MTGSREGSNRRTLAFRHPGAAAARRVFHGHRGSRNPCLFPRRTVEDYVGLSRTRDRAYPVDVLYHAEHFLDRFRYDVFYLGRSGAGIFGAHRQGGVCQFGKKVDLEPEERDRTEKYNCQREHRNRYAAPDGDVDYLHLSPPDLTISTLVLSFKLGTGSDDSVARHESRKDLHMGRIRITEDDTASIRRAVLDDENSGFPVLCDDTVFRGQCCACVDVVHDLDAGEHARPDTACRVLDLDCDLYSAGPRIDDGADTFDETLEVNTAEGVYMKDGPLSRLHPVELSLWNMQDRYDRVEAAHPEDILVLQDHVADLDISLGDDAADRGLDRCVLEARRGQVVRGLLALVLELDLLEDLGADQLLIVKLSLFGS